MDNFIVHRGPIVGSPTRTPPARRTGQGLDLLVAHVDVTGLFRDEAIAMMKKLAADSRSQPGCQRFEARDQDNRLNHFTIVEIWKDRAALDAHNAAPGTGEFRDKLGHMGAL